MTVAEMTDLIRGVVADVLVVPPETVGPDTALVGELGAESIDFLDLVFRLEESLGVRVPIERWDAYLGARVAGREDLDRITPAFVLGFVAEVLEDGDGGA